MLPKLVQRLILPLACAAYAMPTLLGVVAGVGHGLDHFLSDQQGPDVGAIGVVVHEHDGTSHAHGGVVDALLLSAEQVDEEHDEQAPVPVFLAGHVPSAGPVVRVPEPIHVLTFAWRSEAHRYDGRRPLLPPPRAKSSFRI